MWLPLLLLALVLSSCGGFPVFEEGGKKILHVGFIASGSTEGGLIPAEISRRVFDEVEANDSLLPGVAFKMFVNQTGDRALAARSMKDHVVKNAIAFNIGHSTSSTTAVIGIVGISLDAMTMSYASTSQDLIHPVYDNVFRTIPDDAQQCAALVGIAKKYGWKHAAIISGVESFTLGLGNCVFDTFAAENITVTSFQTYREDQSDVLTRTALESVQASGARVVFVTLFQSEIRSLFQFIRNNNIELIGYPYVYIFPETGATALLDENEKIDEVMKKDLTGSFVTIQYPGNPSDDGYKKVNKWVEEAGYPPVSTPYHIYVHDVVYAYAYAMQRLIDDGVSLEDMTTSQLKDALRSKSFTGITGDVSFNEGGDRLGGRITILNYQGGDTPDQFATFQDGELVETKDPVFHSDARSSPPDSTPSYPKEVYSCKQGKYFNDVRGIIVFKPLDDDPDFIPGDFLCDGVVDCDNWADEDYSCTPSVRTAIIVFDVLAGVFIMINIVSIVLVLLFRTRARLWVSGILYLCTLCVGSIVGLSSVFVFNVVPPTSITCGFQVWLLTVGSAFVVSALFVKEARIFWIWKASQSFKKAQVTIQHTGIALGCVLLLDLVILVVWTAAHPFDTDQEAEDEHLKCDFPLYYPIIIIVYHNVLLMVCCVIAIITRKLPSKFNELVQLTFTVYNATFLMWVFVPIIAVLVEFIQYVFGMIFILAWFVSPVAIVVWFKLWGVLVVDHGKSGTDKLSSMMGSTANQKSSGTMDRSS